MTDDLQDRLDALEALADRQDERIAANRERIRALSERIEELTAAEAETTGGTGRLRDRLGIAGLGAAALLVGTSGTAAATGSTLGTSSRPLAEVATDELNGGVTGNTTVTSLTGNALQTVPDQSGQTLATPWADTDGDLILELDEDATVSGGIDVSTVEADFLRRTDTLPKYYAVGTDPDATLRALENLFSEPAWDSDGQYRSGDSHGESTGGGT